jgi:hypothetical protein
MIYFTLLGLTFIYVFLRAFQQKNVMHSKYLWMVPASYGMGFCDVYLVFSIANGEHVLWLAAIFMGTGGCIGSILATYIHNRMHK